MGDVDHLVFIERGSTSALVLCHEGYDDRKLVEPLPAKFARDRCKAVVAAAFGYDSDVIVFWRRLCASHFLEALP
jgi:hypothetical protein